MPCPDWVEVREGPSPDTGLQNLDSGEASAIALAALETDVLLLIDESAGRAEATRRGIPNTGTLGVLRRASIERLVDLRSAHQASGTDSLPFEATRSQQRQFCGPAHRLPNGRGSYT